MTRPLILVLLVVALVSAWVRTANNLRSAETPDAGGRGAWFATDPDSLYHMRRLDRALAEGGHVAARDTLLDHPVRDAAGAPIPWPGMYTRVLWTLTAPCAPRAAEARERFVEHAVATWPAVFGVLTSVLAALAAGRLAGPGAALVAGLYHALLFASMRYSHLGMGDHHAWTSLLHVAWLWAGSEGLARLDRPRAAAGWGAAAGALAGLSLASWVATLITLLLFQAALQSFVVGRGSARPVGLAPLAAGFHAAALVVVLPEVAASPWPAHELVNLSWVHAAELALGLVLALALPRRPSLARRVRRHAPVLALSAGVAALALARDGVRTAWSWLTASEPFMAHVNESQPLSGTRILAWLGWGAPLLPLAWIVLLRQRRVELRPWLFALPVLAGMALLQRRFTDGLGAPMAVALGCAVGALLPRAGRRRRWTSLAAVALVCAAHPGILRTTWNRTTGGVVWIDSSIAPQERALRAACRWLRARPEPGAVLAQWDLGHLVEWVARRPTLATNFGSYLGQRWLDPWRFLGAADEERALEVLGRRDARFVLLGSDWRRNHVPLGALSPDLERSIAARLVPRGQPGRLPQLEDLQGLRLVRIERRRTPDGAPGRPACWVYERVAGALVEARGEPGTILRVSQTLRFGADPVEWSAAARVGPDGIARLRLPHATDAPSGSGRPVGPARWSLGPAHGELVVPAALVAGGGRLALP